MRINPYGEARMAQRTGYGQDWFAVLPSSGNVDEKVASTMNHRWGMRRQVTLRVRVWGPGDNLAVGWLVDISLSGAYIRTNAVIPLMSQIQVEFAGRTVGRDAGRPLRLHGRVVRHDPSGIGVEWEVFASATLREILKAAGPPHPQNDRRADRQAPDWPCEAGM
jgi:hypothetical protein